MGLISSGALTAGLGGMGNAMQEVAKEGANYLTRSTLQEEEASIKAQAAKTLADVQGTQAVQKADLDRGTHAANARVDLEVLPQRTKIESDAKVDVANRSPRTMSPGSSEVVDGKVTVSIPDTKHPKELLDYYSAEARRMNAQAAEIEKGGKGGGKVTLPNIKPEKDAEGNMTLIDQNSGAVGTITAAKPGTPGVSHWFKPDEAGTPPTGPGVAWTYNGKSLQNGLEDLYPAIRSRVGATPGDGAATVPAGGVARPDSQAAFDALPSGAQYINPADGKTYVKRGAAPAAQSSPAASSRTSSPPAPADSPQAAPVVDSQEATALDTARSKTKAAIVAVNSFGVLRQKQDPAGLQKARQALADAQWAEAAAQRAYEKTVDSVAPARQLRTH